ncbi:MAG: hypothetical protein HOW73_40910 [Polyangiaceae bacterium]|nr:hypothetical protein [Polyangiaceae bacterium]
MSVRRGPDISEVEAGAVLTSIAEEFVRKVALDNKARALLSRAARFLAMVPSPMFGLLCRRAGYRDKDHEQLWDLYRKASGGFRPLEHFFGQVTDAQPYGAMRSWLAELDAFENTWLPRTRVIMQRVVPRDRRARFVGAFFSALEQQPRGPRVMFSVPLLLDRIRQLRTSTEPFARDVAEALEERGLTPELLARVDDVIAQVQGRDFGTEVPGSREATARAVTAQRELRAHFEVFRDVFREWSTMFRTAGATSTQLVLLGLSQSVASRVEPEGS